MRRPPDPTPLGADGLPARYRVEYTLTTLDFGGRRQGSLEYDARVNGYAIEGCKTQHPWGEGSDTPGWAGDASVPYCEWQDVRAGPFGYNGFHFLAIVDLADLVQDDTFGSTTWPDQWPAGSAYPDSFIIGDPYTNAYEGRASLTDIRPTFPAPRAPPTGERGRTRPQG